MDKLTKLAKHHKEWLNIVRSFGEDFLAEDIVQETYIKIYRLNHIDKIVPDEVNKSMMWLTLRSVFIDHIRTLRMEKVGLDVCKELSSSEIDLEKHESFEKLLEKINNEVESWHWYDTMLYKHYRESNKSMREIAKETGISVTSIFLTLKDCKERLKEAVGEDYEDYLNTDYELIK